MSSKKGSITVTRTSEISKELLSLLDTTVLGTPGKLRYKHVDVATTLKSLKNLEFIQIKKRQRVLGTAGFILRKTVQKTQTLNTYYVRYLSVFNPLKGRKVSNNIPTSTANKPSALREAILSIFRDELESPFKENNSKGLYYAFVESDNILSRNLCESFGFTASRKISTFIFSRFSPSTSAGIRALTKDDYVNFRQGCENYYKNHSLYFEDDFTEKNTLFGYFENGELIAGLRAFPVEWKLVEVPGFSGTLMQKVLPKLPYFKSLFNPDKLSFLAFDHIWAAPNKSEIISKLMEHSCSLLQVNMGMVWVDNACPLANYLNKKARLGFLHFIKGSVGADLMIRHINMEKNEQDTLMNNPIFISAVDMT